VASATPVSFPERDKSVYAGRLITTHERGGCKKSPPAPATKLIPAPVLSAP
jgi:hypothetical protein